MSTVFIAERSQVRIIKAGSSWEGQTGTVIQVDRMITPQWFLVEFVDGNRKDDCWFVEHEVSEVR